MSEKDNVNSLERILARRGINDPSQFLIDSKDDITIDHTPRIDGVPITSHAELEARYAGGWKLFWYNVRQYFAFTK